MATTKTAIRTDLSFRLNNDRGTPAQLVVAAELDTAIAQAIRWLEPLGRRQLLSMTGTEYAGTQPTHDVLEIRKVSILSATSQRTRLEPSGWFHDRHAASWLWLENTPATTATIQIEGIVAYDAASETVYADAELITMYACALLLDRPQSLGLGPLDPQRHAMAMEWRNLATARKQELLNRLYPPPQNTQLILETRRAE